MTASSRCDRARCLAFQSILAAVLWCSVVGAGTAAPVSAAQQRPASPPAGSVFACRRVRPADERAEALLKTAVEGSATVRRLLDDLERSDLIVVVDVVTALPIPTARLSLATVTPLARYLRISVYARNFQHVRIEWLAHELAHARELAGAPDVRDTAGLRAFYERIGQSAGGVWPREGFETQAAKDAQLAVHEELRSPTAAGEAAAAPWLTWVCDVAPPQDALRP